MPPASPPACSHSGAGFALPQDSQGMGFALPLARTLECDLSVGVSSVQEQCMLGCQRSAEGNIYKQRDHWVDPEGLLWHSCTPLFGPCCQQPMTFKSLNQVRIPSHFFMLSSTFPPLPFLPSPADHCCCPWLTWRQGMLHSHSCSALAGLHGQLSSDGNSSGSGQFPPPLAVPQVMGDSPAGETFLLLLLLLLFLVKPCFLCSLAGARAGAVINLHPPVPISHEQQQQQALL